jgi:uncharacterized protein involved in outer membrane biogenesis
MRRSVFIILGVAGGLVALVLIAAAIAVATVDVNRFAGPLAERLRAATGREVKISGPLALDVSLTPTLRPDAVSLGNAPWGTTPAMLQARRVEAQVALLPLLQRRFEIVRVALLEPQVTLETNAQGIGNWQFHTAPAAANAAPAPGPESAALAGPAIGIREVEIRNGVLRYRNGATGAVTPVTIESFVLRSRDADAPITGEFHGSVDGVPVGLRVNLGSVAALRAQRWPYPLAIDGDVAGRNAALTAKLTPQGDVTRLDALALSFGALNVDGTVTVDRSGKRPRYVVDLHVPRFAPEALALTVARGAGAGSSGGTAGAPGAADKAAAGKAAAGKAAADKGQAGKDARADAIVPDQALPLASLRDADGEGRLRVDAWPLAHGQVLERRDVTFTLQDGRLTLGKLTAAVLGGAVSARGTLDGNGAGAVDVHAEGNDLDLSRILALVGSPRPVTGGKTRVRIDARASGASPRAWVSSLSGDASLLVGPAQLRNVSGNVGKLDELGAAVNPFRQLRDSTELRCAVVRVPVRDGVARIDRTIAFETAELGVSASGTIDFRHETIDLALHPQLRQGISLDIAGLAEAVRLRGPFSAPQVSIDPAKSATAIARIGAALGTGGWSLLGETLINSAAAADSPCAVAQGAKPAAAPAAPARAGERQRDARKPVPQMPGEVGKALNRLLGR